MSRPLALIPVHHSWHQLLPTCQCVHACVLDFTVVARLCCSQHGVKLVSFHILLHPCIVSSIHIHNTQYVCPLYHIYVNPVSNTDGMYVMQVLARLLVGVVRLGLAPSTPWMQRFTSCIMHALQPPPSVSMQPASGNLASVQSTSGSMHSAAARMHHRAMGQRLQHQQHRPMGRPMHPALLCSLLWALGELTPEPPDAHTRFRPPRALMQMLMRWVEVLCYVHAAPALLYPFLLGTWRQDPCEKVHNLVCRRKAGGSCNLLICW